MEIFLFWIVLAIAVGAYASSKGRSGVGFFFLALFLSPLIGFIWVAVSAPNPAGKGLRKCPQCAEWIQPEALKCRYCSFDFAPPVAPVAVIQPTPSVHLLALPTTAPPVEVPAPGSNTTIIAVGVVALVICCLIAWAAQVSSTRASQASEESAIASMRTVATSCFTYESTYSHGYPAKLSFLGPHAFGERVGDFGAELVDDDLSKGAKDGYVFEYTPGRQVRGKIVGYKLVARPIEIGRRSFYVDQTSIIRASVGVADKYSDPL